MTQTWNALHPKVTPEALGLIPSFLDENDPRSAAQQFEANYIGGWNPFPRFKMAADGSLWYPGDPPMRPIAELKFRDETIRLYQYAWVAIVQPDKSYEISRMD